MESLNRAPQRLHMTPKWSNKLHVSGEVCAVGKCCVRSDPASALKAISLRSWENSTIASLGTWVDKCYYKRLECLLFFGFKGRKILPRENRLN
jgi:hypothetical protein